MNKKYLDLKQLQSLSLDKKIERSTQLIREWYEHFNGAVSVSFSGGMDSTVLLNLVRQSYQDVPGIMVKSLPYPEILSHARRFNNIEFVCPDLPFGTVIEKYGYPVVSKRIAQYVSEVQRARGETATKRLRLTGIRSDGTFSSMGMISKKWQSLVNAPFRVSDKCCKYLKKQPLDRATKGIFPFVGTRCEESKQRTQAFYLYGENAYELKRPRSTPLAFWTDADIWEYVHGNNLPYSEIYDMGYHRTGCFACMFGVHLEKEPNRFQMMQRTHSRLWHVCESWGIPQVLDYIGVNYGTYQPRLFTFADSGKQFCEIA